MAVDQQLVSEIKAQLEDDILHFAWILQIARTQKPGRTESNWLNSVLDSVTAIHSSGDIVVGNARTAHGMVLIEPWSEVGQDLRTRMESEIEASDGDDFEFCFWLQNAKHFAKSPMNEPEKLI